MSVTIHICESLQTTKMIDYCNVTVYFRINDQHIRSHCLNSLTAIMIHCLPLVNTVQEELSFSKAFP